MVVWTAACASAPAKIPSASAKPSPKATLIAPGVSVNPALLILPPFTVSTTNPLPAGVSAKQVVRDVLIDNLIENAAVVTSRASLLAYADAGNLLTSEQQEISSDQAGNVQVLEIHDKFTNIEVGSKPDPNDASVQMATIVQGTETRRQRSGSGVARQTLRTFDVLLWVVWSTTQSRYVLCDSASA
jgi:hypothetical protein